MHQTISLDGKNWQAKGYVGFDWLYRQSHLPGTTDTRGWIEAEVPGSVQHDLWAAGQIPDPYTGLNSLAVEWTSQRAWVYKRTFQASPAWQGQRVTLIFHGVDYDARFFLNGAELGEHHDMFTPLEFDISDRINYAEDNLLAVVIDPAPVEQPQIGYTSKVRTLKARMNYWWDFCPRMLHQGIWNPVELRVSGPAALEDLWVRPTLAEDYSSAEIHTQAAVSVSQPVQVKLSFTLRYHAETIAQYSQLLDLPAGEHQLPCDLNIPNPRLWWPNGHGEQALYQAQAELSILTPGAEEPSDCKTLSFGIRTVRFIQNEDAAPGALPYTLTVNGKRIYIKGWNWVPMDALYGVERPAHLERLLTLAKNAHANLLRVWGGGLIEKEPFYDLCDRLGILVWQEFIQSSSGIDNIPPSDPDFIAWMQGEARQIVPLRRNHPSLAIWCGGNELIAATGKPLDESHPMLKMLRGVVAELDPDRTWLPTSSSGPFFSNMLPTEDHPAGDFHDVHGPWEYQGLQKQYELYNGVTSLYHSEFGAEGLTNLRTLNTLIPPEKQMPVSLENPYWMHLAAWWVKETAWSEVFGALADVRQTVLATQFIQFEGVRYALEANRRRSFHNSGSSPWQFNEPYPMAACTSAVDYYGEPKPVYYGVQSAYAPVAVTARYTTLAWGGRETFEAEIWVTPREAEPLEGARLNWRLVGLDRTVHASGERAFSTPDDHPQKAGLARFPVSKIAGGLFLLDLNLTSPQELPLAHNRYLFSATDSLAPIFEAPAASVEASVAQTEAAWIVTLHNTGETSALYLRLEQEKDPHQPGWAAIDQNYFCLLPKEERKVRVTWQAVPPDQRRLLLSGWNIEERVLIPDEH